METEKSFQLLPAKEVGVNASRNIQNFTTNLENQAGYEKQKTPARMTVFSNELIWKTLGRCLNVSDLKCCRLVSQKFNQMVMNETKFKDRVILKVKKKKLTPEELGKTEENWKKVVLNIPVENALNQSNYEWLYPLLKEVEFLSLRLHGKVTTSGATDFHPLLGRLLESCKKLKSLALEPEFIQVGSGRMTSEGMETLDKLEQLEILKPDSRNRKPLPCNEYVMDSARIIIPDFCEKLKNVKIYRSYFTEFRMDPPKFPPGMGFQRAWTEIVFLCNLFEDVVKNNSQHLQLFPFYDINMMTFDYMVISPDFNHETPALMALEVDPFNLEMRAGVSGLISCLKSRPPLERLDISCPFYDSENSTMLSDLISAVARHGSSLKKLKLRINLENLTDWNFLRDSNLQDLQLVDYRKGDEENEWVRQVMSNVPKSIEKLYFRGALRKRGPNYTPALMEPLKTEYFARLNPQVVTELSIFNAGGLVNNHVAQFVCKTFKMLRKLNLSDCQTDDEGFRGIGGLKGLQFLSLKLCGISDQTLKLIRFIELRYLDIAGNLETTVSEIKMTMKGCPSLETLVIPFRKSNFTQDDGQTICPRLKFLVPSMEGLQEFFKEVSTQDLNVYYETKSLP